MKSSLCTLVAIGMAAVSVNTIACSRCTPCYQQHAVRVVMQAPRPVYHQPRPIIVVQEPPQWVIHPQVVFQAPVIEMPRFQQVIYPTYSYPPSGYYVNYPSYGQTTPYQERVWVRSSRWGW